MIKTLKLRFLNDGFGNCKPVALDAYFAACFDHASSVLSCVAVVYHVGVGVVWCCGVVAANNGNAFRAVCYGEKYCRVQDCPPVRVFGFYALRVGDLNIR